MSRQLSFFSAAVRAPGVEDLAGVLCGPGQLVRRDDTARVSVVLEADWRIEVLVAELRLRDLSVTVVSTDDTDDTDGTDGTDGWSGPVGTARSVRTDFTTLLEPLATQWGTSGTGKRPPAALHLDGPMLRLWYIVAGRPWEAGQALGLGEHDPACWTPVGAALAAVGLPAALVGPRGDGPAYRLTGRRRLERLAELIGEPPAAAPSGAWPS